MLSPFVSERFELFNFYFIEVTTEHLFIINLTLTVYKFYMFPFMAAQPLWTLAASSRS
jgi:hypothetical protein